MSDNLKLWQSVEKTPVEHTKAITGKSYQGNSPKPHYLVHKATETFGPCGIGWGFTVLDERIEDGAAGERMSIARVRVWYIWNEKRGEVEHVGGTQFSGVRASGKPFSDEDAPKKSVTDALVKALSLIGFAGDIFMGRYDDSKYMQDLKDEAKAAAAPAKQPKAAVPTITPLPAGLEPKPHASERPEIAEYLQKVSGLLDNCINDEEIDSVLKAGAAQRKSIGLLEGSPYWGAFKTLVSAARQAVEAQVPA